MCGLRETAHLERCPSRVDRKTAAAVTMSEAKIQAAIIKALNKLAGVFAFNQQGTIYTQRGIPDIIACVDGRFVAFEVKLDGKKPTASQHVKIRTIQWAGGWAVVVHSVEEAMSQIEQIRRLN